MSSLHREIYSDLKDFIQTIENPQALEELKKKYESDIKSNRTYDRIKSFSDLVRVLEKRNVLNENNIDKLRNIGEFLNYPHLHKRSVTVPISGITPITHSSNRYSRSSRIECDERVKNKVYETIASKLGRNWQQFGRYLRVPESQIDDLAYQPIKDSVYHILNFHEENCDPRTWKTELLGALAECRRKDLQEDVQFFFDRYLAR
ncbi:uncharacterized protein LOC123679127 [Harmonia axyridis]|uniref:uncharacterized protein LOC123679127 n=1 Tax=Harmonia axyridis TaxID=115357 RepID=UPI001E27594D|nr:uncharacterized protein LOC123679127 [Harmonia axyridis]